MAKLYELTQAFLQLQKIADDESFDPETGEYRTPSERMQVLLDTLDMDVEAKVENVVKVIKSIEADVQVQKAEAYRLQKLAEAGSKNIEWLKSYARSAMDVIDKRKFKSTLMGTIWVQPSQPPVHVEPDVVELLPEEYLKPVPEPPPRQPDKKVLRKALNDKVEIVGKDGKALGDKVRFGEATRTLRFR